MNKSDDSQGQSASALISNKIAELGDWRGQTLGRMRKLILQADPDVVEEWKWMGTPVWSHGGIICTGETYIDKVKLTFAKGASLQDPAHLFNASLDGNTRRAIDIHEGEAVDESAFKALIARVVALNSSGKSKSAKKVKSFASDRLSSSAMSGSVLAPRWRALLSACSLNAVGYIFRFIKCRFAADHPQFLNATTILTQGETSLGSPVHP